MNFQETLSIWMKIGDTKGEQGRFPRFFKVPGNPYTLGHGSFNQGKILEEEQKKSRKKSSNQRVLGKMVLQNDEPRAGRGGRASG